MLILNQYYWPDHSAVAQLATELAEDLVAFGHEVTVISSSGSYLGGSRQPFRDCRLGVRILRVRCSSLGKRNLAGRLTDYLTFFVMALVRAVCLPRQDVVVVTSSPPFLAAVGVILRLLRGSRLVYWLQDVYPALAVRFGLASPDSLLVRLATCLGSSLYRRADAVVALGSAMARVVQETGGQQVRVCIIPNWADGKKIRPVAHGDNQFRREHGFEGKRVVLYSGNMGRAHDFATILSAALEMKANESIVFAFVGDGARKMEVEAAARGSSTIRVIPYQSSDRLSESLSAGDVHVVSQAPATLGLMEPSKLYGVLAVGRPVLYIGPADSEAARTVVKERVGRVVQCGDVVGTVSALKSLLQETEALGAHARLVFEQRYDRARRTGSFMALIVSLNARGTQSEGPGS